MSHLLGIPISALVSVAVATFVLHVLLRLAIRGLLRVTARWTTATRSSFSLVSEVLSSPSNAGTHEDICVGIRLWVLRARASMPKNSQVERFIIANNPEDWVVNDILVDGKTQLAGSGDLPGEMFSSTAIDGFVRFDTGREISIVATYLGHPDSGPGSDGGPPPILMSGAIAVHRSAISRIASWLHVLLL